MTNKIIINNWTGGGTLQTWTDGEWQILYAKDSAENCVTLSLNSSDAIRLAYAVSPTPSEIFERMRAANEAVYEMSYPEARADELRHIADEIDCGGGCEECSQQKLDRGEFCGFVAADNMRKLATALELKSKIDASRHDADALFKPAPVAAEDEAYELGKRDGYEDAIQDLDIATGGDGEFKGSTIFGETVDVETMKQRIVERFANASAEARLRVTTADVTLAELTEWVANEESRWDGAKAFARALLDAFTVGRR